MHRSRSILLFGHDDMLLYTRRVILHNAGFLALYASTLKETEAIASAQTIHLLIFCTSAFPEEKTKALKLIRRFSPDVIGFDLAESLPLYSGNVKTADTTDYVAARTFLDVVKQVLVQYTGDKTADLA